MPDNNVNHSLPPRSTSNTRWSRKWATLGGCGSASAAAIPVDDFDQPDRITKTNDQQRHGRSLFRKASTVSRNHEGPNATSEETSTTSLKKSCSLMNVLRSKLNSPTVLRRFRSKSRENSKPILNEIAHSSNIEQEETSKNKSYSLPKSSTRQHRQEENVTNDSQEQRRSRKRDPSPIQRLAHRIAKLTRHSTHESKPADEQKQSSKSPSKSNAIDSRDDVLRSTSSSHRQDQVDHINACYDEIRAKYYSPSNKTDPSKTSSLLTDDLFIDTNEEKHLIAPPDDPLLQARKQANIKLNCMLSGYTLTTPFADRERIFGNHHLFKFHPYHDVSKSKHEWTWTNPNNRILANTRTRPFSRSIDSFQRTAVNHPQESLVPEKSPIEDDQESIKQSITVPSIDIELSPTEDDATYIEHTDNELFIREDGDPIEPPVVSVDESLPIDSTEQTVEESDDDLQRNLIRAVDHALDVVNQEQPDIAPSINEQPEKIEETPLDLMEMTERALASFENSTLFDENELLVFKDEQVTNGEEKDIIIDETASLPVVDSSNIESVDPTDRPAIDDHFKQAEEMSDESSLDGTIAALLDHIIQQLDQARNGQAFISLLDDEEKIIKSKADAYQKLLQSDDQRLTEEVRTDINAVIGEVNLLLRGKLKQFRGLCQANVANSITPTGEPIPLDSDLEGFWDITYPLIDKVKEKFNKLDVRKAKQWIQIEEYDPNDINNRLKQLQPQQNKTSKIPLAKTGNDDLKKLIQERRKAAATTATSASNQNQEIEIFVAPK